MPTKKSKTPSAVEQIRELAKRAQAVSLEFREQYDGQDNPMLMPDTFRSAMLRWTDAYDPAAIPAARAAMKNLDKALIMLDRAENGRDIHPDFDAYRRALLYRSMLQEASNVFWEAFDLAYERTFADPPAELWRLSPAKMHASGVHARTIAREWRWFTPSGEPDEHRVNRELDNPGSEWNEAARAERHRYDLVQLGFLEE